MTKLFANSGDPDQTPRSAASDLSLHCLQVTHLGVSRLQWVKPGPKVMNLFFLFSSGEHEILPCLYISNC